MPSKHLILCRPLLLLPSIFPSIRVYYNELALHIRWPKCWSFSISPSKSFRKLRAPLMPHAWDLSATWNSLSPPLSLFLPTLKSQCLPFPSSPLPVPAFTLAAFRVCVSDKASVKAASTLQPKSPPPPAQLLSSAPLIPEQEPSSPPGGHPDLSSPFFYCSVDGTCFAPFFLGKGGLRRSWSSPLSFVLLSPQRWFHFSCHPDGREHACMKGSSFITIPYFLRSTPSSISWQKWPHHFGYSLLLDTGKQHSEEIRRVHLPK